MTASHVIRRSSLPTENTLHHFGVAHRNPANRRCSTSCSFYDPQLEGSRESLRSARPASRASMGGTLKPKHIARNSLDRHQERVLGNAYLQASRSKSPPKPKAPTGPTTLLHYLCSQPIRPPNVQGALRGAHARSFDSSIDTGRDRAADQMMAAHKYHGHSFKLQDTRLNYDKIRKSINTAFKEIDMDGNGAIDKLELAKVLEVIIPQGLEHPVDDVDAIFDEVDTDHSGDIGPEEFRAFLEETLSLAEERMVPMDLKTLVFTAFKDALSRVKRERNAVLKAFLEASSLFKCTSSGASQSEQSSRIFMVYNRLLACHVDASLLRNGQRGRRSFVTEVLKEVLDLALEVIAPLPADPTVAAAARRKAEESADLIMGALMGRTKPSEGQTDFNFSWMISFVQEWLVQLEKTELEGAGFGQLASGWHNLRRNMAVRSASSKELKMSAEALRTRMKGDRKAVSLDLSDAPKGFKGGLEAYMAI